MAQSGEQPMQIEPPGNRATKAAVAAAAAAEAAEATNGAPKGPVPTSLMLFHSLVALRPEYLEIRIAEREKNLVEMRRMHEQAREEAQLAPVREQHSSKQEEVESKRRRLLKQQSSGIRLWEAERDDMAAELRSLRFHHCSARVEPSTAEAAVQDMQQLTALRNTLRRHLCGQYEAPGEVAGHQFELRVLKQKCIAVLSQMVQEWFPKFSAWPAKQKLSQHATTERGRCFARMASAVHKLSSGDCSMDDRPKFVVQALRYISTFEAVSQPSVQLDARLSQIRRVLQSLIVGKYAQFLSTLPEAARNPQSYLVQLGDYAKLVMGISILVEVAGVPANLLTIEKDMFTIGHDIEQLLSTNPTGVSSVDKAVTLLSDLPDGLTSLLLRWEVEYPPQSQQRSPPILC